MLAVKRGIGVVVAGLAVPTLWLSSSPAGTWAELLDFLRSPDGAVFVAFLLFFAWAVALPTGSTQRLAALAAFGITVVGVVSVIYHADEPPSLFCAIEWLGLPGFRAGAALAAPFHLAHWEPLALAAPVAGAVLSPVLWYKALLWIAKRRPSQVPPNDEMQLTAPSGGLERRS
jgi:hypothetical protein